jgi:copper(I)-binding protein
MRKHFLVATALLITAAIGSTMMLVPGVGTVESLTTETSTKAPPAPDFGSSVSISDARLVLPARAGDPATVQLRVSNLGPNPVHVTGVGVQHGQGERILETTGPNMMPIEHVPVTPGGSAAFGPGSSQIVLTNYDSNVVPGAKLMLAVTFATADVISVPLTVVAAGGSTGFVRNS